MNVESTQELPYPHNIITKILGELTEHTEHFVLGFTIDGESKVYAVTDNHYASIGMLPNIQQQILDDLEVSKMEEEMIKEMKSIRKFFKK